MSRLTRASLLGAVLGLALIAGCKKDAATTEKATAGAPIAASSTDPLWAMAPADLMVGVVAADGALAPVHGGLVRVLADLEKAPGGAPVAAMIRAQAIVEGVNALDPAALAGMGLDLSRGAAAFVSAGGKLMVLPVADQDKFLAAVGGTREGDLARIKKGVCKQIAGRFVCADDPALLDAAAASAVAAGAHPASSWPEPMRGHIEVFTAAAAMGGGVPLEAPGGMRLSARLERGGLTARVHVIGKPAGPLAAARSTRSSLAAGLAEKQPVGLLVLNAVGLWQQARAEAVASAGSAPPLPGGVTVSELVGSITGEVVGHALPGQPLRGLVRVGLSDEAPMKKLLGACAELAAAAPPGVTLAAVDGRCTVRVDPAALGQPITGFTELKADLWVEGGALVLGLGEHAAKNDARPGLGPFAREILEGEWMVATWGHGSIAGGPLVADKAQLDQMRAQDPTGGLFLWSIHHLRELGVAMRVADDGIHGALRVSTLWANPDEVVTAVQAKVRAFAEGNYEAMDELAALAKKHPDTPFGRDIQAGAAGLTVPAATVGVIAAVSIPAFVKYMKKSKTSEARAMVMRLHTGATSAAAAGVLPGPSAGPTPPPGACCQQGETCAPDPALWAGEPWRSLGFSIDDPHRYSYQYELAPGGKRFTVRAIGDLDCDGVFSTFQASGELGPGGESAGSPRVEITDELE